MINLQKILLFGSLLFNTIVFNTYSTKTVLPYNNSKGKAILEISFNKKNNELSYKVLRTNLNNQVQTRSQSLQYKKEVEEQLNPVVKIINNSLKNKDVYFLDVLELIQELDAKELLDKGLTLLKATKLDKVIKCKNNTSLDPKDAKLQIFLGTLSVNIFTLAYLVYSLYTLLTQGDFNNIKYTGYMITSLIIFCILTYKFKTKDHLLFKLKMLLTADPQNLLNIETIELLKICDSLNLPVLKEIALYKSNTNNHIE